MDLSLGRNPLEGLLSLRGFNYSCNQMTRSTFLNPLGERRSTAIALAGLFVLSATVVSAQPKNQVVATIPVGTGPGPIVVNPTSKLVYVVNEASNAVSVIEATTNTVAVVIPVGVGPGAVAINPAGKIVYVENSNNGNVSLSVIYTPINAVVKTIDAGSGYPIGGLQLAVSPDGSKLYVATGLLGEAVPVIDTATNEVSKTIKLDPPRGWGGETSGGVVFNSSGRSAYVTFFATRENSSGETRLFISQIDAATGKQTSVSGAIGTPSLGWTSIHGHTLYISNETGILVFDTKTKKVVKTVPIPGYPRTNAVTPDGKYLYVPYYPNLVATIDTATYKMVGSPIQVGQGALGVAIAPDGLRAYVTNATDGTVSVIDISPISPN